MSAQDQGEPVEMLAGNFRGLVDGVRDYAIFMLDREGRVGTWNRGAQEIKGYAADEIIGQRIDRFYLPEDRAAGLPQKLLDIARREGRVEQEGWRVRKDGTPFWADVVITALHGETGKVIGFTKVTRDLTARRQAEDERLQAEQRFRLLVDSVADYAIFMLDLDGYVATWNPGAERTKGYAADEIIGEHFSRFYPEEDVRSGKPAAALETALREGRFSEENWRIRKDGTRFWAHVVISPLRDRSGQHVGFAKVTRDLTERRNAEEQRIRLAQADEAVRLRDEFLSIASHELRTPLTALQLQLERAVSMAAGSSLAESLARAGRSVERLSELVETLLDVSRIAAGRLQIDPARGELAPIVTDAVDRLQETATKAGCKVATHVEAGLIGNWDALRIGQVVTNILANAFKYAARSDVEVELRREGGHAVLRIHDRGPGIAPDQIGRIFGRFERAAPMRHFGGLGLGLYVAQEIVAAHGGTIAAFNRDGGGMTFEIRLPLEGNT